MSESIPLLEHLTTTCEKLGLPVRVGLFTETQVPVAWGFIVFADNQHQRMRTHPHKKTHPPGSVLHPPAPRDAPTGPRTAPTWLGYAPTWLGYAPTPALVSIVTTFGPIEHHSGYKGFRPSWNISGMAVVSSVPDKVRAGSSWWGSPPVRIRRQVVVCGPY